MASEPPRVVWSETSIAAFQELTHRTREQILYRVDLVTENPMMYQVEQHGQWAGLRRFQALDVLVFYTYRHQDRTVYLDAIVPARSKRR